MDNAKKALDEFRQAYEATAKDYEARLKKASQQYEAMMKQAQADFDKYLGSITGDVTPSEPEPPIETPPAAVWTKEQGENFLILNQQAAVLFMAIFDRMGPVFDELQKMTSKK